MSKQKNKTKRDYQPILDDEPIIEDSLRAKELIEEAQWKYECFRYNEAKSLAKQALELHPDIVDNYYYLQIASEVLGQSPEQVRIGLQQKSKKKKHDLGQLLESHVQTRYPLLAVTTGIIFIAALFIVDMFVVNWNIIYGLFGFFALALIVAGILSGELLQIIWPRKNIKIYENGIQFISKRDIKTYRWQQFHNINIRVIQSKEDDDLLGHAYNFSLPDGTDITIGMSEYLELGEELTVILMKNAPEQVTFSDVYV